MATGWWTALAGLRVLLATGDLTTRANGTHWIVLETAKALKTLGHSPVIVGTTELGRSDDVPDAAGVDVRAFPRLGPTSMHFSPGLGPWLMRHVGKFDVVSLQSVWLLNHWTVARWCRRHSIPYMVTAHGNLDPGALHYSRVKKSAARWLFVDEVLRGASCLQGNSRPEVDAFRQLGLVQPACIVSNGVALGPEVPQTPRDRLKRKHGLVGHRVCLFLGRLHPKKGLEDLLHAWTSLHDPDRRWVLAIAGPAEGGYEEVLKRIASLEQLGDSARFLGPRYGEEKEELLGLADLFVLPSRSEGMPMAVLEALAHGVPVLITDRCCLRQVEEAGAGVVVEPGVESLRSALAALLNGDSDALERMGSKARRLAEDCFQWPRVAADLVETYKWMLRDGPPPRCLAPATEVR